MYKLGDYAQRGGRFLNNRLFPAHKKLSTLMIYATDVCDSACKHCLIWAKRPVHYLEKEKIFSLMESKCITRHTSVGLEGGEFMLHPDAVEILEWFHKNHPHFDLLSNCLKPEGLISAVKKYPPRRLYVSLDGDAETYLHMRGKPGYGSVIQVIEALHKSLPISVMFTLSPYNNFEDMRHVAEVCKHYGIDMRVGIYNDIAFFDTVDKAHDTEPGEEKNQKPPLDFRQVQELKAAGKVEEIKKIKAMERTGPIDQPKHNTAKSFQDFVPSIPPVVREFAENYDFLVLYNQWRKHQVKLKCFSILDSLVVLPNGDVPICQSLDLMIGNIHRQTLDEIFNGPEAIQQQHHFVHNCNQCWLNFHRKYDVVLYRSFEKYFGRAITRKMFGYYQWSEDAEKTYADLMESAG